MTIKDHEIYRVLSLYKEHDFFLKIIDFIKNDELLFKFLSKIDKTIFMSTQQIDKIFNKNKKPYKTDIECRQWDEFLSKNYFSKSERLFFHDIVGHITLKNGVNSKGEILATVAMCGFSFVLGRFYFINAILIFVLGYKLFDDTISDHSDISCYVDEINNSYNSGKRLREYLGFDEKLLEDKTIEEYLAENCEKLMGFKL